MSPSSRPLGRRELLASGLSLAALLALPGCRHRELPWEQPEFVEMSVEGTVFRPKIELAAGAQSEVSWLDLGSHRVLGTGRTPTLDITEVRRVGMRVELDGTASFGDVLTLNLGFDHTDDAGRFNIGETYDHEPQPIRRIRNLPLLTGLRRFCAGRTPLAGVVDFSGLSELRHIECFQAAVGSVDLSGCTSLVRLCLERCRVGLLDLNPVRRNLRDLRAAVQQTEGAGLGFATLDGPMESLYHFCVRDQLVYRIIPHRHLPVVEEYWVWGTRQTESDGPTSPVLRSFLASSNAYDQTSVDLILASLSSRMRQGPGRLMVGGQSPVGASAAPSAAGRASADELQARGWEVITN